jgi:hypothetical protein
MKVLHMYQVKDTEPLLILARTVISQPSELSPDNSRTEHVRVNCSWPRLVAGFPPRRPRSGQVGFVVDKVALGQVFSQYFGFPCQSSFHQLLHSHPHLSSGAGTIGQKWLQYKGLSPTPLAVKKKNSCSSCS